MNRWSFHFSTAARLLLWLVLAGGALLERCEVRW